MSVSTAGLHHVRRILLYLYGLHRRSGHARGGGRRATAPSPTIAMQHHATQRNPHAAQRHCTAPDRTAPDRTAQHFNTAQRSATQRNAGTRTSMWAHTDARDVNPNGEGPRQRLGARVRVFVSLSEQCLAAYTRLEVSACARVYSSAECVRAPHRHACDLDSPAR